MPRSSAANGSAGPLAARHRSNGTAPVERWERGLGSLSTAAFAVALIGCGDAPSAPDGGHDAAPVADGGHDAARDSGSHLDAADASDTEDAGAFPWTSLEDGELRPGGATTTSVVGEGAFVQEAANLGVLRRADFEAGLQFFQLVWEPAPGRPETDGLGPTFNAASCVACHVRNGRGLPATAERPSPGVLLRLGSMDGPDPVYGGQLQPFGVGVPGEAVPVRLVALASSVPLPGGGDVDLFDVRYELDARAFGTLASTTRVSPRIAQQLVGQGLLEAIGADALLALADPDDRDGDGISGRVAYLGDDRIGRFGWKATQPDTRAQTAAAFAGDLGITSSLHPDEDCPAAQVACAGAPSGGAPELPDVRLRVTASYVRLLGVPARRGGEDVLGGKALFHRVGCAACHQPSFHTSDALEPELAEQRIWPYSDLLLHDMGPGLDDGMPEGAAESAEWRTPPLWGLGLVEVVNGSRHLLHDGRASTLAEAILWHGGEGQRARDAYARLSASEREALHAFVESL